jgi:fructokinase
MYGGVEAGGTKFVCLIGTDPESIVDSTRIDVGGPAETIGAALDFFRRAIDAGARLEAIGIGSFGPVELRRAHPRYGWITTTPKPRWSGTDLVGPFASAFGVPVGFDTDVNAAALAEGRWGAARGLRSFVYLTLGTGIGGGAVVDGRIVHGLGHTEIGHIAVQRRPGDAFPGGCPFHGDCFEGMASGPAVEARFGRHAETLSGADREEATALVAFYLAAGVRSLVYALAPERIVVGGGLSSMPGLVAAARVALVAQLAGYPGLPEHAKDSFLVPAALGGMAGPAGTLILAEHAAEATAGVDRTRRSLTAVGATARDLKSRANTRKHPHKHEHRRRCSSMPTGGAASCRAALEVVRDLALEIGANPLGLSLPSRDQPSGRAPTWFPRGCTS